MKKYLMVVLIMVMVALSGCSSSEVTSDSPDQLSNALLIIETLSGDIGELSEADVNEIEEWVDWSEDATSLLEDDPNETDLSNFMSTCDTIANAMTLAGHPELAIYVKALKILMIAVRDDAVVDYKAIDPKVRALLE